MAKVITTIAAENGLRCEDVYSFKTYSYVGIWDQYKEMFAVMKMESKDFSVHFLDVEYIDTLEKLDRAVRELTEESILEVFEETSYSINLEAEE